MSPPPPVALLRCPILALCLAPTLGAEDPPPPPGPPGELRVGMSPEQVRARFGPPARVARQILHQRMREQWVYDRPRPLRLTFDHPRGRSPTLLTIHRPTPRPG